MSSENDYPKQTIMSYYTLFGGIVGTFVLVLIAIVFAILESLYSGYLQRLNISDLAINSEAVIDTIVQLFEFFASLIGMSLFGLLFGMIPAFITGWWVVKRQLHLGSHMVSFKLFMIGSICAFIYGVLSYWGLSNMDGNGVDILIDWQDTGLIGLILAVVGGTSAVLIGKVCLPRTLNS